MSNDGTYAIWFRDRDGTDRKSKAFRMERVA